MAHNPEYQSVRPTGQLTNTVGELISEARTSLVEIFDVYENTDEYIRIDEDAYDSGHLDKTDMANLLNTLALLESIEKRFGDGELLAVERYEPNLFTSEEEDTL